MTVKNVAPRCPDGQHELYPARKTNRRVTKCRKCRASVRIPATPDPVSSTVAARPSVAPFTVLRDKRVTIPAAHSEPETYLGTCSTCGQEWEFIEGQEAYCPDCEISWQCEECGTRKILAKRKSSLYPQCDKCGWREDQTLGELLSE
jgi:hypothetical protein